MKKLTKNEINWIKRLATKGDTPIEIAKKTGIAYQSVRYHARKVKEGEPVKKKVAKKKVARKLSVTQTTTKTTQAVYESKPDKITPIHRKGNELHNVDVTDQAVIPSVPPLVAPEKESSGEAVLWLLVSGVVFILALAIANM